MHATTCPLCGGKPIGTSEYFGLSVAEADFDPDAQTLAYSGYTEVGFDNQVTYEHRHRPVLVCDNGHTYVSPPGGRPYPVTVGVEAKVEPVRPPEMVGWDLLGPFSSGPLWVYTRNFADSIQWVEAGYSGRIDMRDVRTLYAFLAPDGGLDTFGLKAILSGTGTKTTTVPVPFDVTTTTIQE